MISAADRTTAEQIDQANASGRTPVVFIHGLWLLPTSWDRWVAVFEAAGYAALTPGWPDDPETVEAAKAAIMHLRCAIMFLRRINRNPAARKIALSPLSEALMAGRWARDMGGDV